MTDPTPTPDGKTGDANLDDYIVDPKKDPISPDYVEDPDLVAVPAEFEEVEEEAMTPAEVQKAADLKAKQVKAEEAEKNRVIAADLIKKRAEEEAAKKKAEDAAAKKKEKAKTVVTPKKGEKEKVVDKKEDAARYKKILEDLGFVLQEAREEGKIQYALEYGELRVGRTFTEGFPTGKFWARKDGNFLDPADVKELGVVKDFYAARDGKKASGEVAPPVAATAPANVPAKTTEEVKVTNPGTLIKRQIGSVQLKKKGGYYNVSGHKEPDAWLVQQWAIELGVSLKVVSADQNDKSAKAIVRAEKDGMFVEAVVMHYFDTSRDVIALEIIENMQRKRQNPIEGYREDGRPLLSQETNYNIYKRVIRFMNFSLRDAVTKASRIATLKILNHDWRDPEEIEAETAEVQSVNSG